jgi:hypothetical protein
MAVKGKKKSQSRGSQGRRRPAAAPRAAYSSRARAPWYRTATGRAVAALVVLLALVAIVAVIQSRPDGVDLTQRKNDLDQYTGDVRGLLQGITPAATEENAVPNKLTAKEANKLKTQSKSWLSQISKARQSVGNVTAPTPTTQSASLLFVESVTLYGQAASIYGLAADAGPSLQVKMLKSGADLRNQATGLWQEGINILEQARAQAKMPASGLRIPTSGAVAPPTPTTNTVTPSPSSGGSRHKKKHDKGNGGQGSK